MKKEKTFNQLVKEAAKIDFTEGAQFMIDLKFKKCFYKDKPIDKWELWAMGFRNVELLENGVIENIEIR